MLALHVSYIITLLPLLGTLFVASIDKNRTENVKLASLWTTSSTLILAILQLFIPNFSKIVIHEAVPNFINKLPMRYSTNVDDCSMMFVTLISLVCFLSVMWLWKRQIHNIKSFFISLLLFEAFAIGAFYSANIFMLFFCMEATLIPIYSMMLSWTGAKSNYVLLYISYSMLSALLILIAIIMIYIEAKSPNLFEIYKIGVKNVNIFWLLIIGIGIKMPIWPLCSWLPIVHTKSNVICSALLASIVLKFSTLILIRFIDPLFPEYTSRYREIFIIASIVSMSFAVISIMFQEDLKRIFSYFSIIHMNLYFMIFLSDVNRNQFIFSTLQHGLTAILMFFTSDVIENLFKTRSISIIKNSTTQSHKSKILLLFVSLALIGAPYTSGFIAETISFYSIIKLKGIIIPIITLSIIAALSAYTLFTYHSMFCKKKNLSQIAIQTDGLCDNYQMTSLVISYFCILLLGIFPALLL